MQLMWVQIHAYNHLSAVLQAYVPMQGHVEGAQEASSGCPKAAGLMCGAWLAGEH